MKNLIRRLQAKFLFFLFRQRPALLKLYTKHCKNRKPDELSYYYHRLVPQGKKLHIIQVGANDGLTLDPLRDLLLLKEAEAVLIEPHPYTFHQKLLPLYKDRSGIQLVNLAIGEKPGEFPFYSLSFSNKRWATGLGSFQKEQLEMQIRSGYVEAKARKHKDALPENGSGWIGSQLVKTVTFGQLLDMSGLETVDILQIDAEGYDVALVNAWPFERTKPQMIGFEADRTDAETLERLRTKLQPLGYKLVPCRRDLLAWLETGK